MFRALKVFLFSCLFFPVFLAGVLFYACRVEPRWIEETHWELPAPNWKGRSLRLAVLADLHAGAGDGDYLDEIVRRILLAQPDAVLMLGDYADCRKATDIEALGRHLAPLAALPCFAVLGNHDYNYGAPAVRAMLKGFGAKLVERDTQSLYIAGDNLHIAGIYCPNPSHHPEKVTSEPEWKTSTCIVLSHAPNSAKNPPAGATAVLAGHTHGGQICLPGGIPLLKQSKNCDWGSEQLHGVLMTGGIPMYITRGLGTGWFPMRLFCRPELLFVEVRGDGEAAPVPPHL